ncbi:MAG TPA: GFA family protein [Xanthobacteraceae bacterium]|nr:GFA family protein [Xanthobacteraceae bacterium]
MSTIEAIAGTTKERTTHFAGRCFCGAVKLECVGSPEAMGYCHCSSCRSWSAAPVTAFTLWKPEAVRITSGKEHVATFSKTKFSQRQYCTKCGGHLLNNHPTIGLVDVYAATIPTLTFTPGVHINYVETVLPMKDGLPKLKDFPKEFGGSGQAVPE